jgi:hypothetical protein
MPFEPDFNSLYEDLVRPALEDAGYVCNRADSVLDQQNVMRDVIQGLGTADLVVAELTGLNPNVLYEVGLAHGLRVPTVLLSQSIDDVPFDLRSYRIQTYSTRFDEAHRLKDSLRDIAEQHRRGALNFGSPVTDFLVPGSGETRNGYADQPSANADPPGEDDLPGVLDQLTALEEAGEILEQVGARIGQATEDVGDDMRRHTDRIEELQKQPGPGALAGMQRLASTAASDLTRYATRLEEELPIMERGVNALVDNGLAFLNTLDPASEEERRELRETRESLAELLAASQGALEGVRELRDSLSEITGVSRELDRAARRVANDLGRIASLLEQTESYSEQAVSLVDDRLSPGT